MTNPNYTHLIIIADRSGSMVNLMPEAQNGLNQLVQDQAAAPGVCRVTLVEFDNEITTVHESIPAKDMPPYVLVPRGMTSLHDAIGQGFTQAGEMFAAMPEDDRPGTVIALIVSDGDENNSTEWRGRVKDLIVQQREQYGWQVTYLGTNQDALAVASDMGIPQAAAMSFAPTASGASASYVAASASILRARSGGTSLAYSEEERGAAAE